MNILERLQNLAMTSEDDCAKEVYVSAVAEIERLQFERDASLLVQRNASTALDAMREALQQIEDKYAAIMRDPPDWVRLTPEQLKWVREAWYGASLIARQALEQREGWK